MDVHKSLNMIVAIIAAATLICSAVPLIAMWWHGWAPKFLAKPPGYWPRRIKRRVANSHWHWVRDYNVELYEAQGFRKVRCHWFREVRLRQKAGFAVLMQQWDVGDERTCEHFRSGLEHVCTTVTGDLYQRLEKGLADGETMNDYLLRVILASLELETQRGHESPSQ